MSRTTPLPEGFFGDSGADTYAMNTNKAAERGLEPCVTCGRGVAPGKGSIIIVVDGGASALHPDDQTDEVTRDPGFMGGYVIGSSCVKKIPAAYRTVWEGR